MRCSRMDPASIAHYKSRIAALQPQFLASLEDRLQRLDRNARRLQGPERLLALEESRFDIHKIAGTAASFGYSELGKAASTTSDFLATHPSAL